MPVASTRSVIGNDVSRCRDYTTLSYLYKKHTLEGPATDCFSRLVWYMRDREDLSRSSLQLTLQLLCSTTLRFLFSFS